MPNTVPSSSSSCSAASFVSSFDIYYNFFFWDQIVSGFFFDLFNFSLLCVPSAFDLKIALKLKCSFPLQHHGKLSRVAI